MRVRPEAFDADRQAGVVMFTPSRLDADGRRRVLAVQDTLGVMGQAMHTRFENTSIAMPENIAMGYWPELPRHIFDVRAGRDVTQGEFFTTADPAHDPDRKSVWTKTYWDIYHNVVTVSLLTPVYDADQFV